MTIEQYVADIVPENDMIELKKSTADELIYEVEHAKLLLSELVTEVERDHDVYLVNSKFRPKYMNVKKYLGLVNR